MHTISLCWKHYHHNKSRTTLVFFLRCIFHRRTQSGQAPSFLFVWDYQGGDFARGHETEGLQHNLCCCLGVSCCANCTLVVISHYATYSCTGSQNAVKKWLTWKKTNEMDVFFQWVWPTKEQVFYSPVSSDHNWVLCPAGSSALGTGIKLNPRITTGRCNVQSFTEVQPKWSKNPSWP